MGVFSSQVGPLFCPDDLANAPVHDFLKKDCKKYNASTESEQEGQCYQKDHQLLDKNISLWQATSPQPLKFRGQEWTPRLPYRYRVLVVPFLLVVLANFSPYAGLGEGVLPSPASTGHGPSSLADRNEKLRFPSHASSKVAVDPCASGHEISFPIGRSLNVHFPSHSWHDGAKLRDN